MSSDPCISFSRKPLQCSVQYCLDYLGDSQQPNLMSGQNGCIAFRPIGCRMHSSLLCCIYYWLAVRDALNTVASGVLQYWLDFIEDAQQPILMSSRDGKLIKPVPPASRLSATRLHHFLERVMDTTHMAAEARRMLCDCWCAGDLLSLSCNTLPGDSSLTAHLCKGTGAAAGPTTSNFSRMLSFRERAL